jgi:WD40 repeat protein
MQYAGHLLLLARAGQYRFLSDSSADSTVDNSLAQITEFQEPEILIQYVSVSPNGRRVLVDAYASVEDTRFAQVIDFNDNQVFRITAEMLAGIDVAFMRWASTDTVVVYHQTGSSQEIKLEVIDIRTGDQSSIDIAPQNPRAWYEGAVLSSDNRLLAIATLHEDRSNNNNLADAIEVYHAISGDRVGVFLTGESDSIYQMSWSPTSNTLVFDEHRRDDGSIHVLNWHNEEFHAVANLQVEWAQTIQWSPNGRFLLYRDGPYGTDAPLKIFDITEGTEVYPCVSGDAHWSPDSQYVAIFVPMNEATADKQAGIYLFEMMSGELYRVENLPFDLETIVRIEGWVDVFTLPDQE